MSVTIAGIAIGPNGPVNGATVYAWLASRFSGTPAQGAAPPSGSPDAGPVTSGTTYGSQGSYQISVASAVPYNIQVISAGITYWTYVGEASGGGGGSDMPLGGGVFTGNVDWQEGGDLFPRITYNVAGSWAVSTPFAPLNYGTHSSGTIGSGSDWQWLLEPLTDTAWGIFQSFPRVHITDGTHYLVLTYPATFPLSGSPTLTVSSTSGLAGSGTLTVDSVYLGNGTITYTSVVDGTHLGGCSSSGLTTNTDTTARHAYWLTDSYTAPILWWDDFGGIHVNDQITFNYGGVFTSNEYDIIIGYQNTLLRNTGSAIYYGSDALVYNYRTTDIFGNPIWIHDVNSNIFTFGANGIYPNAKQPLGTSLASWGVAYLSGLSLTTNYQTTNYAIAATDSTVFMAGTSTATLPDCTTIADRIYTIVNAGANVVTLATTSSQTINGSTIYTLSTQYSSITVQSNGSAWFTIGGVGSVTGGGGGGGGGDFIATNLQTTTYTPVASDLGVVIEMNSSSATQIILNSGVFSAGDIFEVCQIGTGTVSFVQGGSAATTITHVADTNNFGNALAALAVTPAAVGNIQLLATYVVSTSVTVTPSGGGCSTWTQIGSPVVGTDTGFVSQLWRGTVTTAGSSTISITFTGTIGTDFVDLSCHEFSSGVGTSTTWSVDVSGTVNTLANSTTVAFPSLVATGSNELYFGALAATSVMAAGSTSGYSWYGNTTQEMMTYKTSVSGTQAPTATQGTTGKYSGIAAILIASGGSSFTIDSDNGLELLGQWATVSVRYRSASEAVITGGLGGTTTAAVAAIPTYNVVTYGADPSGVADSTAGIFKAIVACPATGGVVYFPAGTYNISSTFGIGNGADGLTYSSAQNITSIASVTGSGPYTIVANTTATPQVGDPLIGTGGCTLMGGSGTGWTSLVHGSFVGYAYKVTAVGGGQVTFISNQAVGTAGAYVANSATMRGTTTMSNTEGVRFVGVGAQSTASGSDIFNGSTLKWIGASGATMIQINGPYANWGFEDITFDGNNLAGYCLVTYTANKGYVKGLTFLNYQNFGLLMHCNSGATPYFTGNSWKNIFIDTQFQSNGYNGGFTGAIYLTANTTDFSDTCFNIFKQVTITTQVLAGATTYGIYMNYSDNNKFEDVEIVWGGVTGTSPLTPGTNYAIVYDYTIGAGAPSDNQIDHIDFASTSTGLIANNGSPSIGNAYNRIRNVAQCNGIPPAPAIAGLQWGYSYWGATQPASFAALMTQLVAVP